MIRENATVALFDSRAEAEKAIQQLREARFDMKQISLVARDNGFLDAWGLPHRSGRAMRQSRDASAFWLHVEALLGDEEFYDLPGIGRVVLAGPIADWVALILDHVSIFGGMSALGAGLHSIGISKEKVVQYEKALKEGRYLLLVHGAADQVAWARAVLGLARDAQEAHR